MTRVISYCETPEFQKDFKKLLKKYTSLEEDLELVKVAVIELFHIGTPNSQGVFEKRDIKAIFPIQGFCAGKVQICKIKKFACKTLKGKGCRSGIRVIYSYFSDQNKIEFLQIYYKDRDDTDCNYERIKEYLKNLKAA